MPAPAQRFGKPGPRERLTALAGVLIVQIGLGLALFSGFRVYVPPPRELVTRLIEVTLPPPPPPTPIIPKPVERSRPRPKHEAAPPPRQANPGGSPGPARHGNTIIPKVQTRAAPAALAGGGSGTGASQGGGAGGGVGTGGAGEDEGGSDLEKIAGDIYESDYPPNLGRAGIGGRVSVQITVGTNGAVTSCRVTRSSGNAQLDSLTCRLIEQRYRFRPSTDRYGRPIPDQADVDQDWIPPR